MNQLHMMIYEKELNQVIQRKYVVVDDI